jgi:hypothetical protein
MYNLVDDIIGKDSHCTCSMTILLIVPNEPWRDVTFNDNSARLTYQNMKKDDSHTLIKHISQDVPLLTKQKKNETHEKIAVYITARLCSLSTFYLNIL